MLGNDQREAFDRDGFILLEGFASSERRQRMHDEVVSLCRAAGKPGVWEGAILTGENNLVDRISENAEDGISKVFKLHRRGAFHEFINDPVLVDLLADLIGPKVDCFLSQFIFKNPGAWGQPWHQDSHYFPFDRKPQIGIWLAITEATLTNGCLSVVPGSHREPLHEHVPDRREGANFGYFEIVDHDMSDAAPVLIKPGDTLVFHSHLMHCSLDNVCDSAREAMVYHCAQSGTRDLSTMQAPVNDWMPLGD
ncbi:MAG: phytanoyl-CoA dioxygenase family protein [bacterium]|nr:phytanoyl-CoA dioxygenase family protein [bacterium]